MNNFKYYFFLIMSILTIRKLKQKYLHKKQKCYDKIHHPEKKYISIKGCNNSYDSNKIFKNKIFLTIEGNNNKIHFNFNQILGPINRHKSLYINIRGNNNTIFIGKNFLLDDSLTIFLGNHLNKVNNAQIIIGKSNSFVQTEIYLLENNSSFKMGNDCMFSRNIIIRSSDCHTILDLHKKPLNCHAKNISIGNHVWCGEGVCILKNAQICDHSIIGTRAVVTKKFTETNIAIGGIPAKIIKRNVDWDRKSPQVYLDFLKSKKQK